MNKFRDKDGNWKKKPAGGGRHTEGLRQLHPAGR
jgi:hypothetical protein